MNPFLCLPPETAHKLVIKLLRCGLVPQARADDPALERRVLGQVFSNPVGLPAGAEKEGAALKGWERLGFGFVEVGTVMPHPRAGNPSPRMWRFGDQKAVVNWLGLPSQGPEAAAEHIRQYRQQSKGRMKVGVSIASVEGKIDEFKALAARFAPIADYLTIDVSCPNVAGPSAGDEAQDIDAKVGAVLAEAGDCPVLLKLRPTRDAEGLKALVQGTMALGVKGYAACNTVPFGSQDLLDGVSFEWPERGGQKVGGYSGPKLLPISTWMVSEIRKVAGPDIAIIGVGGIQSGEDAKAMMEAGADLVQVYTGFIYQGPGLIRDIKKALLV